MSGGCEQNLGKQLPQQGPSLFCAGSEHDKVHKNLITEVKRAQGFNIHAFCDKIDEVRSSVSFLKSLMDNQEAKSASLISDMNELSKDLDVLTHPQDAPSLLLHYLNQQVNKYVKELICYKEQIEKFDLSIQMVIDHNGVKYRDMWASLVATRDNISHVAAQLKKLHEDLNQELIVHKNCLEMFYKEQPKPSLRSLSGAMSDSEEVEPLEKQSDKSAASPRETMYLRTTHILKGLSNLVEGGRAGIMPSGTLTRAHPQTVNGTESGLGLGAPAPNPTSVNGSIK